MNCARLSKYRACPDEGIIKESAPAQFEINMAHSDDVLALADQIVRMQRGIRTVAARYSLIASFMPKPIDNEAGNGMHVHCSLLQDKGGNVFNNDSEKGSTVLRNAIAGCLALMPESMLIFAPSFNAYRRFQAATMPLRCLLGATIIEPQRSASPPARRLQKGLSTGSLAQMPTPTWCSLLC